MIKYYFNDTAPEINFEKQNKSFHFPWSNGIDSGLISSFDESWRIETQTQICLLEAVMRFASIFKFDKKEP